MSDIKKSNSQFQLSHIITADGSSTLILNGLNEQYHSINGALQESTVVYIQNGLNYFTNKNLKILEIGFGTGLNCLLSYAANAEKKLPKTIDYTALEPFPINIDLLNQLNYDTLIETKFAAEFFKEIHQFATLEKKEIQPHFFLTKSLLSIQQFNTEEALFDLIYFDAFSPSIQPEMWTLDIFIKLFSLLKKGGILVTYCAKGEVKRTLKTAGFKIENLAGPPGKREVTRAIKV